ncbi:universal stress protein [Streptomyces sp. NA02950]|uniref:universal stress protein n=1 Tax=Streptomyces sp. NA02950 TaxID=2742137 RepID=UPI001590346A|nr:universal stress protein [Streptomyces sp. NA02950]QKV97332.1 universal stress protein [Streptomyces sp. NA02950]
MALPLVVGVDGSESSFQAVDWAVDEAARHEVPLRLVYASRWERYEGRLPSFGTGRPSAEVVAENIIASCADRAASRNPEVKVSAEVLAEDTVSALLREGREAFAVVTGSRGRGEMADMLLGSVSLAVASRSLSPVVVVRGAERNRQGAFGRVVLAVGDVAEGAGAVRFAFREARARDAELRAVRTWRRPSHSHAGQSLLMHEASTLVYEEQAATVLNEGLDEVEREQGGAIVCHRDVVEGPAHRVLQDMSVQADLLVVGALRRRDHTGLQLGRVSHAVLHRAACPVAIVPQRS